jgi:hypothetical protein
MFKHTISFLWSCSPSYVGMEGAVKKEAMVASSLDTEAAGQDNGYTIIATAHAVDSGLVHMIRKLCPAGFWL